MDAFFHLSLPCENLVETKIFYVDTIGASLGRYSQNWLDISLYGHQVTFTKAGKFNFTNPSYKFEGEILSSFHFGVIVDAETHNQIYSKLKNEKIEVTEITTFLEDKIGEHKSFFVTDPNGYKVEFKCFKNANHIFKV